MLAGYGFHGAILKAGPMSQATSIAHAFHATREVRDQP